MKKYLKSIFIILILIMIFIEPVMNFNIINATEEDKTDKKPFDFWEGAQTWYNEGSTNGAVYLDDSIMSQISRFIKVFGTSVITIVTVVLGMKYMLGGATGKAEVKQQLIGLLVACLFFFGWSNLSDLLIRNAVYNETTGTYDSISTATQLFIFSGTESYTDVLAKVFAIVVFLAKIVAIIAIMVIGAKYILSGANGKAELKQKGPMFIIGILMIFCTLNILTFISNAINQALQI